MSKAPPEGTVVTYPGGEAVFAKYTIKPNGGLNIDCSNCVYEQKCLRRSAGEPTARPCIGGVYLDKQTYLEMKLLGELV